MPICATSSGTNKDGSLPFKEKGLSYVLLLAISLKVIYLGLYIASKN